MWFRKKVKQTEVPKEVYKTVPVHTYLVELTLEDGFSWQVTFEEQYSYTKGKQDIYQCESVESYLYNLFRDDVFSPDNLTKVSGKLKKSSILSSSFADRIYILQVKE